jgi:hypothetical protein
MRIDRRVGSALIAFSTGFLCIFGGAGNALLGACGPFTDFTDAGFCPFVLEIFYLGITTGTTPTTYSPSDPVTRLQMAAFLARTVDRVTARRRAPLGQLWTPLGDKVVGVTTIGANPLHPRSDGLDVWVTIPSSASVTRVRGSDGAVLGTWTGAPGAVQTLIAMGRVFVAGGSGGSGRLYRIDPAQPPGAVTTLATNVGSGSTSLTFDGSRIFTSDLSGGSISIIQPGTTLPWGVGTITLGFTQPNGMLFDGANVWVTDPGHNTLLKLSDTGAILQTVTVGEGPYHPVFDGTNIWVPNLAANSVSVVRASNGSVLATLTGNGLTEPYEAAFDGERTLVTNAQDVSLWRAADLTAIGSRPVVAPGVVLGGACSDGQYFWIAVSGSNKLVRF